MPVTPTSIGTISTGVGNVTLTTGTGLFRSVEGLPSSEVPPPPAGVTFPHGAMAFEVYDVPVGGTITVSIETPGATSGYWKVVNGTWRRYTGGTPFLRGLLLTLTDGGTGDADGRANGIIVDPGAIGVTTVPPGHITDVSGLVQVTRGALLHDAGTGRDSQTLTLRNTARADIDGPVSLVFEGLTPGVSLALPAGITRCAKSTGAPYVLVDVGTDQRLTSRESAPVTVEFLNPTNATVSYRTRVLAGDVCQTTTAPLP
ncbi:MAG: choice-of-anchor U domain-containing protein [Vicinamibacterales bacterium]